MARRRPPGRAVRTIRTLTLLTWALIGVILVVAGITSASTGQTLALTIGGVVLVSVSVDALWERYAS